ncbi:Uncharacterised protein [uncultured archaeon]|nr:Uncharacterised protein [uncultured archaeon]
MIRVAVDSDIFFFSISSDHRILKKRNINPTEIKGHLQHLSSHAGKFQLSVPISVLGESVTLCLEGEREGRTHNIRELHDLISFWGSLNINILHPNAVVATICYRLNTKYKDERMTPRDIVHVGYALAYDMNYLVTTDKNIQRFRHPEDSGLEIVPPERLKLILDSS